MNPYALFVGSVMTGFTLALVWDGIKCWLARKDANLSRVISDALEPRPEPEQHAGLYDHEPIGPLAAAGIERQANRFAAELEDDGGIWAWLDRGTR